MSRFGICASWNKHSSPFSVVRYFRCVWLGLGVIMQIVEAQRDVRTSFMGGFAGQLVSAVLWLSSAAVSTWASHRLGMIVLFLGGFLIYPLTQLVNRLMGRAGKLRDGNALNGLATQVAFTLPLNLPLVLGATLYREEWFYPAFMVALGAHYLPFVFLY